MTFPTTRTLAGAARFEWAASAWAPDLEAEELSAKTGGNRHDMAWTVVPVTSSTMPERMGRRFGWSFRAGASTQRPKKTTDESKAAFALLNRAYSAVSKQANADAFRMLSDAIEDSLSCDSLDFVNEVLRQLQPSLAGRFVATGVLRATFRVRKHLPTWHECAAATAEYLEATHEDVPRVMRGLIART